MKELLLATMASLILSTAGYAQMIVAHRGASFDAPENTLAAFNEAWEQAADGIEGDFYYTSDKHIVCIHDKDTERTAGIKLPIGKSSLAELKKLDYGKWKGRIFEGQPIPTFAEVAAAVPSGKTFVIELKTGPEIVTLLKHELARTRLDAEQLLIIAFDSQTIAESKKQLPNIRAHWLTGYKQDKLTRKWKPTAEEICRTLRECSADGLGMQAERAVVNKRFIAELTAGGMREFHVWTVDDPQDARYFRELGAVGITTNRPALIRSSIESTR